MPSAQAATLNIKTSFDVLASAPGDSNFVLTDGAGSVNVQQFLLANVDRRGLLAFDLAALPAGATITAASIDFDLNTITSSAGSFPQVRLYAHTDEGVAEVSDALNITTLVGTGDPVANLGPTTVNLDAGAVQSVLGGGSFLEITALGSANFQQFGFETLELSVASAATLNLTYVVPVPEPATLSLLVPAALFCWPRRAKAR
jgi:hypothetical protein